MLRRYFTRPFAATYSAAAHCALFAQPRRAMVTSTSRPRLQQVAAAAAENRPSDVNPANGVNTTAEFHKAIAARIAEDPQFAAELLARLQQANSSSINSIKDRADLIGADDEATLVIKAPPATRATTSSSNTAVDAATLLASATLQPPMPQFPFGGFGGGRTPSAGGGGGTGQGSGSGSNNVGVGSTSANRGSTAASATVAPLSYGQLWRLFIRAGLPFFGFGLCDNLIMITVGDAIDATFGVTLGFSTMVAAGFGQAVSDGAGISIQGAIENASDKLGLPNPEISPEQASLASTRWWTQAFRTIGIVAGCLVGVLFALFTDDGNRPRLFDTIFRTVPENLKKDLLANKEYRVYREGEHILTYGAEAPGLFMIVTGEAEIVGRDHKDRPIHIHTHKPGDTAGAMEITFGHPCVADVIASSSSVRCLFIKKEDFEKIAEGHMEHIREDVSRFLAESDEYIPYRLRHLKV